MLSLKQVHSFSSDPADHFWIPDSGATSNMTSHKEWIVDYIPLKLPIRLGDDSVVYSAGVGKVWFEPMLSGHHAPPVCLSRVLHVPRLKSNLLSITYLSAQQQVKVCFINSKVSFEKNGGLIMEASINAHKVGKLIGRTLPAISIPQQAYTAMLYPHDIHLWRRLGHRRVAAVERAIKHSVVGVQLDKSTTPPAICVPCVAGKQHRDPFPSSEHSASCPMEIIYCDLHGPFNVRTRQHKIYWAVFTDLYSRTRHLALLGTKLSSELLTEYRAFEALGKARFGEKGAVLVFRCDGGGEFLGELKRYLRSQGTQYQQTTWDIPQQNGISERANRDIGEGLMSVEKGVLIPDHIMRSAWF
jgi:hypothetical protein